MQYLLSDLYGQHSAGRRVRYRHARYRRLLLSGEDLPSGPRSVMLSRSFQKYADVFLSSHCIFIEGAFNLLSKSFKSWRLNFHSNGLAVDSQ
jgi:hypothetical protein